MEPRFYIFSLTLLFLFVFLGSLNVLYANGVTLEMIDGAKTKLPKGPSPSNHTTYDPTQAQTFTFTLTGFEDDEYYEISASLTRSNFKGYAAHFPTDGDGQYKDLEFLKKIKDNYTFTTLIYILLYCPVHSQRWHWASL